MTFKDASNIRSPQKHVGLVHSSNLCTEIILNTSEKEIAVCNLGSINLSQHIIDDTLTIDIAKLKKTIKTAIRMLDNVIDINYYSVSQSYNSNINNRPIGLGIMGFQDALYKIGVPYNSEQAVNFSDICMEYISYFAIKYSSELAVERGTYNSYKKSLWHKGVFPINSMKFIKKNRGEGFFRYDNTKTINWNSLIEKVKINGIRNSNLLAVAPTATIANICGVVPSIEPIYKNLYVKSNLSGEFTVINNYLVQDLKKINLWNKNTVNEIKYYDGILSQISILPDYIKKKYISSFEIDSKWLIVSAARRQKWIDQAQSLNLYINEASGSKLDELYTIAWFYGLKTTYYLRSVGASDNEKATINNSKLNSVKSLQHKQSICESCE